MKRLLAIIAAPLVGAFLFLSGSAVAQSVQQAGPWAPGHAPMYLGSGFGQPMVQDSGTAAGGAPGVGINEMGLTVRGSGTPPYASAGTGPFGTNWCDYDAPTTNATGYHFLCLSPNAQGGGLLAFGSAGSAAVLPFQFNINGSYYNFPFTIGGIVGPGSSTVGDIACWNNTTGNLLKDCGNAPLTGPVSSTVGDIALWNNTTGTLLKDGGSIGNGLAINSNILGLASIGAGTLLGNPTGGSAIPSTVSVGSGLSLGGSSISLASVSTNTVLGNVSGSSAAPSAQSVPSCATGLTWTLNVGFGCATGSTGRTLLTHATTFYYGLSGSDTTGAGTSGNPWRTRAHALAVLQSSYDLGGQTVTVQAQDNGPYTDSLQCNGPLVGQTSAGALVFAGFSSSTVYRPTAGTGYVFSAAFGCQFTVTNAFMSESSNVADETAGADTAVVTQPGSSIIFGAGVTWGFNVYPYNGLTVAFGGFAQINANFAINAEQIATTATFTSGGTVMTVASATGIVKYEGIVGTGIPSGAYVSAISGTSVTIGCLNGVSCTFSASEAGSSVTFSGGGQTFVDMGNGAQLYLNTNGTPNDALTVTCSGFPSYQVSFIYANDNSSANFQALNSGAGCQNLVAIPFTVTRLSSIDTGLQGVPYFPGAYQAVTAQTVTTTSGSTAATISGGAVVAGQAINGYASTTSTFSGNQSTITVASATNITVGNHATGLGIASGTTVTNVSGTSITLSFPTTASETSSAVLFTGSCIPNGTTVSAISGTSVTLSQAASASCSGMSFYSAGSVANLSLYQ